MRLDKFLVVARLVKQRTRAKELCDGGHVKADGRTAKAAFDVRPGQSLLMTFPRRRLGIKVVSVPEAKSVPKEAAAALYEITCDENVSSPLDGPDA